MVAILGDEHATTCAAIAQLIRTQHHMEVLQASSAAESVALAQSHNPALVLMELMMPGLDTFTAAAEIRRLRPDARIAILTRKDDPEYVLQAREMKLNGLILKMINISQICVLS